jgi:hypothetical protein
LLGLLLVELLLRRAVDDGDPAGADDIEAEVAASDGPLVVLLGQHRSDQADDRGAVGEVPTTSVRLRSSRLSRSWGLLLHSFFQVSLEKAV